MINFRTEMLTFNHVSLAMKALGKFHAISFALKDQHPKRFEQLASELSELYYRLTTNSPQAKKFFEINHEALVNAVQGAEDAELSEKLAKATSNGFVDMARECIDAKNAGDYAVICHGDAWVRLLN